MPVGLIPPVALLPVRGLRTGTAAAGIRRPDRPDLALFEVGAGAQVAAVFTQNQFCAAPVVVARRHLAAATPRALLVNTGYANAGTGADGEADALACCRAVARALGCRPEEVLPFSTGIIGGRLPVDRIKAHIAPAAAALSEDGWLQAAHAIMTTDTVAKGVSRTFDAGGRQATITGIAKGSGMIEPNMATMLAFVATDAHVPADLLQELLLDAVGSSFNSITVDGDTSTNDACVAIATGQSGLRVDRHAPAAEAFQKALRAVCEWLAQAVIRDAEGATKFVTVAITGARDREEARSVAYAIGRSPLVKTALFAQDPNWGRLLAAVGRAVHRPMNPDRLSLHINGVSIFKDGAPDPDYREQAGVDAMHKSDIEIGIDLGLGSGEARIWTCDLSYEYVRINGDYRS